MIRFASVILAVLGLLSCGHAIADDALALQYATEAVEALEANLNRLNSVKATPASQLAQLKLRVFSARQVLYQLRGDDDAVRQLFETKILDDRKRLQRLSAIAKRGYAGPDQLRVAKLRLLMSEQDLALHTNDKGKLSRIIEDAIVIEKSQLTALQDMASRGYAATSSVVDQKLRIAQIVATQRVIVPDKGS